MYCINCGSQVPEGSAFCHDCGGPVGRATSSAEPPSRPALARAQPPATAATTTPTPTTDGFRIAIGVGSIIGAALVLVGTFLPWASVGFFAAMITANGFDYGYITDWGDSAGKDGVLTLLMAIAAGGLAVLYLYRRNTWSGLGILALGIGAGAVGGYNLAMTIVDIRDGLGISGRDALDYVGEGLYIVMVGGLIMAVTGLVGFVGALPPPHGGRGW